jgi:hypothetical protein
MGASGSSRHSSEQHAWLHLLPLEVVDGRDTAHLDQHNGDGAKNELRRRDEARQWQRLQAELVDE